MHILKIAAIAASLIGAGTPAFAQRQGNTVVRSAPVMTTHSGPRGGWSAPRPNGGNWNKAPQGGKPGGWNNPRPNHGGWNNTPRPNNGGWNNTPRPNNGGWNNTPRPNNGNWNNTPRPNHGGWNNNPRPNHGGWNNNPRPNPGKWNGGSHSSRWGNKIDGHWYAGHNAPGGWKGYRRPSRGFVLPSYWIAPNYYISNYSSYGLSLPPQGYNWSRYYDDAVLLDQRGQVWDSVSGVDWDRYDDGYAQDGGYDGYDRGYVDDGQAYASSGDYAPPPPPQGYVQQGYSTGGYSYSGQQGGYVSGGYWYPPTTTTTVTIGSAPVETVTTTTEYIEERTSYVAPKKVWRAAPKKVWKARRKCDCN